MIKRVDHISMAVESIEEAMKLFVDLFGARVAEDSREEEDGYRWVTLDIGSQGAQLELLEPLEGSDGFVSRFLAQRGEGFHHVTLETPDILAAMTQLKAAGIEPFHTRLTNPAWKETFVHPRQGHGVLYQLCEREH